MRSGMTRCARAVERLAAFDDDLVGSGTGDRGAHREQEVGEIDDLRLAGAVREAGRPVGEHRGHHEVLGAGHGLLRET